MTFCDELYFEQNLGKLLPLERRVMKICVP